MILVPMNLGGAVRIRLLGMFAFACGTSASESCSLRATALVSSPSGTTCEPTVRYFLPVRSPPYMPEEFRVKPIRWHGQLTWRTE